jgi:hypothetical protein
MKISKATLSLLKAYSAINPNIMLKANTKTLATIAPQKNIMSDATIEEDFPVNFGVYDISEFLSAVTLFDNPDFEFTDKNVKISEGKSSITFWGAAENVLTLPTKEVKFPEAEINFKLPASLLDKINKSANVLKAQDLSFIGDGSTITLKIGDKKIDSANSFSEEVGETTLTFTVNLKIALLKLVPGDYEVEISTKKISKFQHTEKDLKYYLAVESDSTFA